MGLETVALKGLLYVAKMYAAMLVSLGGTAINSAGVQLGISSYSRPLTKMSFSEIFQNLQTFASNLSDPKIQEEISNIIKSTAGNVQKAIILLVTLAQETATASSYEICKMPGISNACQVSELAHDVLNLGIEKVENALHSTSIPFSKGGSSDIHDIIRKKHKIKGRINRSMSKFLNVSNDKNKNKIKNKTKKRNY